MAETTALIELQALSVGFDKKPVLQDATIDLIPGAVIAIAGPNGAGKSTLLKTIARQIKPVAGTVRLNGTDIWQMRTHEYAAKVAYVPQDIETSIQLTVEQMVMLGRNPHQLWWQWYGSNNDTNAVNKALESTEMQTLRDKPICQLSGGERQRAALATAIAQEPQFMLLDEPTSHLDFKHQNELLKLLKNLRGTGLGIMIVLHDLNVIARIADQVVLLEQTGAQCSRVAACGSVQQVLSTENLKRVFDVDVTVFDDPTTGETVYNPFSLRLSQV